MADKFWGIMTFVAIAATLMLPGYTAYIGSYVTLGISVLGLAIMGWTNRSVLSSHSLQAIHLALLLLAISVPFVYRSSADLMAPVLLLPMLAATGLAVIGTRARQPSPTVVASLALAGATIASVGGLIEHLAFGVARPGLGNNPIHYATLAVFAGSIALVGVSAGVERWRYVFLVGPLMGLSAAVLSGSRGPLVAGALMAIAGMTILGLSRWRDPIFRTLCFGLLLVGCLFAVGLLISDNSRLTRLADGAFDIFQMTGGKDDIRAALYASAVEVLRRSPWVGVGFGSLMTAAETMFPDLVPRYNLENLHADWANMGTMAGLLGLFAYALLLIAPLLLLIPARSRRDQSLVLLACLLSLGQVMLGLSNAMFGVLPQTVMFATMLGYLVARSHAREREELP